MFFTIFGLRESANSTPGNLPGKLAVFPKEKNWKQERKIREKTTRECVREREKGRERERIINHTTFFFNLQVFIEHCRCQGKK
jgi:hypothetical protein